jgi:hypothetical protein
MTWQSACDLHMKQRMSSPVTQGASVRPNHVSPIQLFWQGKLVLFPHGTFRRSPQVLVTEVSVADEGLLRELETFYHPQAQSLQVVGPQARVTGDLEETDFGFDGTVRALLL